MSVFAERKNDVDNISERKKLILKGEILPLTHHKFLNDIYESYAIVKSKNVQERLSLYYGILEYLKSPIKIDNITPYADKIYLDNYLVCCFTIDKGEADYQELFWAHYADSHNGVCIIYDMNELISSINKSKENGLYNINYLDGSVEKKVCCKYSIGKVDYSGNKIVAINDDGSLNGSFSPIEMMIKKSKVWKYENEVRLIFENNSFNPDVRYYLKINPKCIKEIRFGYNMTDESCRYIINNFDIYSNPNIKFSKMTIADDEFKLVASDYNI